MIIRFEWMLGTWLMIISALALLPNTLPVIATGAAFWIGLLTGIIYTELKRPSK